MDYKNKYEQSLERARIWKDKSGMPKDKQGILDDIFPELKEESEDEKTKKEIINYLECQSRDEPTRKDTHNRWISYIKKHALSNDDYDFLRNCARVLKIFGYQSYADRLTDLCPALGEEAKAIMATPIIFDESKDDRIRKALIQIFNVENFENYDIKNEEVIAWLEKASNNINSIYDKELSELLHIVIRRFINDPNIPYSDREKVSMKVLPYVELLEKQGEGINYANKEYWRGYCEGKQEILDKYTEIKKQGEDKKEINNNHFTSEQASILNKHIDKFLEQNPAWTEEDEKFLDGIIANLECLKDKANAKTLKERFQDKIDWLKSLRPKTTWKPSDEQMNLLEELVEDNNQRHFYSILKSLYEQLKKLREE